MTRLFDGEVALVTGGSSGIGRAAAIAFAAEGAKVAIASRRSAESLETVKMVEAAGGEGFFIKADVSNSSDVESMVGETVARFGALTYAFNNAASRDRRSPPSPNIRRPIGRRSSASI